MAHLSEDGHGAILLKGHLGHTLDLTHQLFLCQTLHTKARVGVGQVFVQTVLGCCGKGTQATMNNPLSTL